LRPRDSGCGSRDSLADLPFCALTNTPVPNIET
jgi:hypothetical protein